MKRETAPEYSELEKAVIAWSLAWEGGLGLEKVGNRLQVVVYVGNMDLSLLEKFSKEIARCGKIYEESPSGKRAEPYYNWRLASTKSAHSLLKQVTPYIPIERKKKIGELLVPSCQQWMT